MIMDNQVNNTHTFVNNNNFNNVNSLTHLLDTGEPEVEVANIKVSEYCDNIFCDNVFLQKHKCGYRGIYITITILFE